MQRDNYLEQIIENAKKYKSQLLNKTILFVYRNEKGIIDYIEAKFEEKNFRHLTGVETRLKPGDFFNNCINHSLGANSFVATSTTPLKLSVFNTLVQLPSISASIGEFNGANPRLQCEIIIAKYQMVLGLKRQNKFYFPVTLLKEGNHFDCMKSQHPILITFTREGDSETAGYNPTYINKKCEADKVFSELPRQIQVLCHF
ncbi:MAG: PBECR4 domain-containing protein [Chloroflexi bacterium]|nr:PBECR4 domain-containing protein [Chloroflexota bacterium]